MQDVVADQTEDTRLQTLLLGSFAVLALVLSSVGLYGVMSYTVTQRTPLVFAAVGTLLAAIATIAYAIPAHRATVIDPTQALRAN